MKKIGMRNFKTAIAVCLCIVVMRIIKTSDSPMQACIAAIISMQSSVFESFKTGKNRMIGTFIGALMGFLLSLIYPGNLFLITVGIIILIHICYILDYNKSTVIACIVFISIMINVENTTPIIYSTHRLIETFIGIIIAVLVNYFISPPKYLSSFAKLEEDLTNTLDILFCNKLISNNAIDLSHLNEQIAEFEDLMKSYISDILPKKESSHKITSLQQVLKLFKEAQSHLFMLNSLNSTCFLNEKNSTKAKTIFDINEDNTVYSYSNLDIVYNFHIENLFNIMEVLRKDSK